MKDHLRASNHARVQASFRRGLQTYHGAAQVQAGIATRLVDQLGHTIETSHRFDRVFEFGCGTGHLTQAFLARHMVSSLWLNDLVPESIPLALSAVEKTPENVHFLPGPVEEIDLPEGLDLIMSASTLQWVEDIPALLRQLRDRLASGGYLALSSFGQQHFHQLYTLGSTAAAPSYSDAAVLQSMLPEGMTLRYLHQAQQTLHFRNLRALLRHLRDTGVNGQSSQNWSRRRLSEFEAGYFDQFGTPEGLPLTYDPVWLIAQKA